MKQLFPKVSVIIVNYNQANVTHDCLRSLQNVTYPSLEIFVVDNASCQAQRIRPQDYPNVICIESDINLGFAGGNNLAIKKATGEFILLLNNDTEVTPDFLQPLVSLFSEYTDAGIASPKIIFHSTGLIQYAGANGINSFTGRGQTIGYNEEDKRQYDKIERTALAHGACMLIKRDVLNKIGLLHESYFLYYEEFDYCEMAKRAGFSIYYNGFSHIRHKQSVSVGKLSSLKAFYMAKNRILFARRNFKGLEKIASISFYWLLAFPKNVLSEMFAGRYKNSLATIKGACRNFVE